ncbi:MULTISPECIES: SIMPL domain-containing protein [unclassified Luteococcus]|uniref:SIMPL domain-containing protein n=1 Tax=unclassified Luteococcus TaxID=2639923 RepID=UPI00313CCE1B
MIITVAGHHRIELPAELATLHLEVLANEPERADALRRVEHRTGELLREVKRLENLQPAPVERHVVNPPQVWTLEVTDAQGNQTGMQHRADVAVRITFRDATALSDFTSRWGESDDIQLGHVAWDLTEATRTRYQDEVLTEAIADARRRARVMAAAVGAGDPTLTELADPGLLAGPDAGQAADGAARFALARSEPVEVAPDLMVLSATVHARFQA